jgi:hypothetical protein
MIAIPVAVAVGLVSKAASWSVGCTFIAAMTQHSRRSDETRSSAISNDANAACTIVEVATEAPLSILVAVV